ncbi:FAS1-like dehydratase domain-containing protein [Neoactinobaculum massilliense]|uniref:FAS1-like dehydratase domain-containing protein n=1 Tax=Neoactinobaculum massilliense TaxID=2364794 RepID=UPI000F51BD8A|nr:MaoC family dehydratase N-terminal domain-containing protein [Neoactinobaculum massilliense]
MVNVNMVGRTWDSAPTVVTAGKIAEFSRATRATSPVHFDRDAAVAAGYKDVVAPLTFTISVAQEPEFKFMGDPESEVDFQHIVHGGEKFEYHRPVVAGDVLTSHYTVKSIVDKGKLYIIVGQAQIVDAENKPVLTTTSTLIQMKPKEAK